jgi:hypothetical protein
MSMRPFESCHLIVGPYLGRRHNNDQERNDSTRQEAVLKGGRVSTIIACVTFKSAQKLKILPVKSH